MTVNHPSPFEEAIGRFTEGLRKRDAEDFRATTLNHLRTSIANLQAKQHSQRRLQNLTRLEPFIEAIEQYGTVVSDFCDNTNIVAFVWVGYQSFICCRFELIVSRGPSSPFFRYGVFEPWVSWRLIDIVQTTSIVDTVFGEILSAYESIGEALPLLEQHRDVFRDQRHMIRNLEMIYEDVLTFQRIILRYFQQPRKSCILLLSYMTLTIF